MNYLNLAGIVLGSASVGAILGVFGMAALVNYDDEEEADRRYRLGLRKNAEEMVALPLLPRIAPRPVTDWEWPQSTSIRTVQSDLEEDR